MTDPHEELLGRLRLLAEQLDESLLGRPARDGDCMTVAPMVTDALAQRTYAAVTATLIGWADQARGVLAYAHTATVVLPDSDRPVVVDLTAQQFRRRYPLPAAWVDPLDVYCARLAAATWVPQVTLADWHNRTSGEGNVITCPRCGATSHNPNDVREGYCGRCHDWTSAPGAVVASIPPAPGRQDASLPSVSTRRGPARSVAHRVAARLRRRPPTWYAVPIVSPYEARLRAAALDGHVCRRVAVRTNDR